MDILITVLKLFKCYYLNIGSSINGNEITLKLQIISTHESP